MQPTTRFFFQQEVGTFCRSQDSRTFEERWLALPRRGRVPARRDFSLRPFAPMLRDMVLLDICAEGSPWSRIRLVGEGVRERVQSDITGRDYLEFLSPQFHGGAAESVRLMFDYPCGMWQVMAAHYQRGFSQYLELTAFPLATDDGNPQLLCLMQPYGGPVLPMLPGLSVMSVDTAVAFEFLDAGSGAPSWPPAAP